MKRLLLVSLVSSAWAIVPSGAWGDHSYHPGHGGIAYLEKEIETCDYVCETVWHEVKTKVKKPKSVTVIEKQELKLAYPSVDVRTRKVEFTTMVAVKSKIPVEVYEVRYLEHTDYKTIHVDQGHWVPICGGCGGPCACQKVWVPMMVEKKIPYTYLVPKLVATTVEKEVVDYVPKMETREVKYPVVKMEFKSVTEETPVTRMVWEEEEITIKVPHVTVKKVPCKKVIRMPLVCSVPCHDHSFLPGDAYPYMTLPGAVPLKSDEIVPPPDAKKKEEPKKDEPKKDAPKK